MLLSVDPNSGVPVYRQIVDQVRYQIAAGLVKPGDELPSTRVLSSRLGVNPMTISKAYGLLEEAGFVVRRQGLPLVVAPFDSTQQNSTKLEQLETALQPAVAAAVQLSIPAPAAAELLRKLIDRASRKENS